MSFDAKKTELATRCLWSLQEAEIDIDGLLLTNVDGLTLTSTLDGSDRTERLAAISTAMFLLGEQTSEAWGSGESMEVFLTLQPEDPNNPDDAEDRRHVYMKPVGYHAVLVAICRSESLASPVHRQLNRAAAYLTMVLAGSNPPLPRWGE